MKEDKTPISQATDYLAAGDYWDSHDLAEHWDDTVPVEMQFSVGTSSTYFALDSGLTEQLRSIAQRHGISAETLLNLWVREKAVEESRTL